MIQVAQFFPHEPLQECAEKQIGCDHTGLQIVDVSVLQFQETLAVNMTVPQERISERILEHVQNYTEKQIVDVPDHQLQKETLAEHCEFRATTAHA